MQSTKVWFIQPSILPRIPRYVWHVQLDTKTHIRDVATPLTRGALCFRFHVFESGVMVLQLQSHSEAEVVKQTEITVKFLTCHMVIAVGLHLCIKLNCFEDPEQFFHFDLIKNP